MDTVNYFLNPVENFLQNLGSRLPDVLLTILVGLVVIELIVQLVAKLLQWTKVPGGVRKIMTSLLRAFLLLILFLAVIQALGLNNILVALTGSAAVFAILLSAGVAPVVSDILAGLTLGSNRHFQPGQRVKVGPNQTEGTVRSIELRNVILENDQGKIHYIPNAEVQKNEWVLLNPTAARKRTLAKKSLTKR